MEATTVSIGRFYVLIVTCLLGLHHNSMWVTFSTIPNEAKQQFNLSDDEITLLAAYGPIPFVILMVPLMWFMEHFGLKVTMLISSWLLAIGCGMRCFVPIAPQGTHWTVLLHIGHLMNGVVGVVVMMIPTRLSSLWFPPRERTMATAATTTSQPLGVALAFVGLPYLTRKYDIKTMLYVEAEIGLFLALLATIYFPAKPPTPPSVTADEDRLTVMQSIKLFISNRDFILLVTSGGLFAGTQTGLTSVLSIVLNDKAGYSDAVRLSSVHQFFYSIPWLGACRSLCGVIGGHAVGMISNRMQKRFKSMILFIVAVGTLLSFWFAVSIYGYTLTNPVNIFITLCLLHSCNFATAPLYYEAAVEVTYPASEEASAGVLSGLTNFSTLLFQIIALCKILTAEHPERALVLSWVFGGLLLLSWLCMVPFKEKYTRLNEDIRGWGNIQAGPKKIAR